MNVNELISNHVHVTTINPGETIYSHQWYHLNQADAEAIVPTSFKAASFNWIIFPFQEHAGVGNGHFLYVRRFVDTKEGVVLSAFHLSSLDRVCFWKKRQNDAELPPATPLFALPGDFKPEKERQSTLASTTGHGNEREIHTSWFSSMDSYWFLDHYDPDLDLDLDLLLLSDHQRHLYERLCTSYAELISFVPVREHHPSKARILEFGQQWAQFLSTFSLEPKHDLSRGMGSALGQVWLSIIGFKTVNFLLLCQHCARFVCPDDYSIERVPMAYFKSKLATVASPALVEYIAYQTSNYESFFELIRALAEPWSFLGYFIEQEGKVWVHTCEEEVPDRELTLRTLSDGASVNLQPWELHEDHWQTAKTLCDALDRKLEQLFSANPKIEYVLGHVSPEKNMIRMMDKGIDVKYTRYDPGTLGQGVYFFMRSRSASPERHREELAGMQSALNRAWGSCLGKTCPAVMVIPLGSTCFFDATKTPFPLQSLVNPGNTLETPVPLYHRVTLEAYRDAHRDWKLRILERDFVGADVFVRNFVVGLSGLIDFTAEALRMPIMQPRSVVVTPDDFRIAHSEEDPKQISKFTVPSLDDILEKPTASPNPPQGKLNPLCCTEVVVADQGTLDSYLTQGPIYLLFARAGKREHQRFRFSKVNVSTDDYTVRHPIVFHLT